jgi:hypothetical protein
MTGLASFFLVTIPRKTVAMMSCCRSDSGGASATGDPGRPLARRRRVSSDQPEVSELFEIEQPDTMLSTDAEHGDTPLAEWHIREAGVGGSLGGGGAVLQD